MTRRGFVILLPFPRIQLSNISLLYLLLLLLLPLFFIFPVVQTKNLGVILHFLSTTLHIQSISKFYKFYFKADPELKYSSPLFQPHSIAANLVIIFFLDYCTNLLIFLTRMPVSAVGSLWSTLKTTARVIILFKKLLFWNNYRFTRNYKEMYQEVLCPLHTVSPDVCIFYNYSMISISTLGSQCWYNSQSLFRFHQSCMHLCVCSSMQFYW